MNRIDSELIEASKENNLLEVLRLLSVGADVDANDITGRNHCRGWTPLHVACFYGHAQVVKVLREHGADIEANNCMLRTPLYYACLKGRLAVVNELLSPNDSSNGTTTSILDRRKSRGASIQAKDFDGNTPLHIASWRGHLPVVKVLLSGGANILAANNHQYLPINKAVTYRHSEVAKCLLQHSYATIRHLPLHELLEDLTWIFDHGINDVPPPLRAALDGNVLDTDDVVEIIEYLAGQNPELLSSSRDQDGSLPLHVACHRGASFAIVQSLVNRYKASVKSMTPQGDLPLLLACEMPDTSLDTIFILMRQYPDVVYG
jgi:ankyrin repeat protein